MTGNEVGVEMSQEDVLDFERVFGGERDVLIGVALRIDDGCAAGGLVADGVGLVGQARQIELLEDHLAPTGSGFFSRLTSRRYGLGDFQPCGYFFFASPVLTAPA